jgi:hypothetical protein
MICTYTVMSNSDHIPLRRTGQKAYEGQIAVFFLSICCWPRLLKETYPGVFQMPHRHISGDSVSAIKTQPLKHSQIMSFPQMSAQKT